jgi:hypothetical protein
MTSTTTFAAGVAVFKGFEGMRTEDLGTNPLAFWYRTDGHCGAGAPRFNVRIDPDGMLPPMTFFFGCNSGMVPGGVAEHEGRVFHERIVPGPLPAGEIVSIAIVFDEGNDVSQGFTFLDNIRVGQYVWTSASDNGNDGSLSSSEPLESLLGAPIRLLFP